MSEVARNGNGQFQPGTEPGPGRPKRAIESDYARVVADAVSLEAWRAIVDKAVTDAKDGDPRAREFIASRLVGTEPLKLMDMAIREYVNMGADEEISSAAELMADNATSWSSMQTPLDHAIVRRVKRAAKIRQDAINEQTRLTREAKKAEHDAKRAASSRNVAKAATDGK